MSIEESVKRLREKFLAQLDKNEDLYHEVDVSRVRTDDWQVERFLVKEDNNEDKAFASLVKALQWKKSFGIHERTDLSFPREIVEWSQSHTFGRDKEGRLVQWEKNKNDRKISELTLLTQQYIAHNMERNDQAEPRKGFVLVADTNGSGLSTLNVDNFKFKIEITQYYPEAMQANYVVDLPWVLSGVSKIILSFADAKLKEKIQFINRKELTKYIDEDVIPVTLGGKREPQYVYPEGLKTMKELSSQLGLNDKVIKEYYKSFDQKF